MLNHEKSTDLLDSTMSILEADITTETPQSGTGVIDQWLQQLRQGDNTSEIADTLERVKTQLKSDQINADELSELLTTLATQTTEFGAQMGPEGDIAYRIDGLASSLRSLAAQLGNK